jgi:predicted nucleotidyltransferase
MRVKDSLERLRPEVLALAAAHGAEGVRVFGSVARGEETPESDVDLLVTLRPGTTLLDLTRLELALEALLGRRSTSSPKTVFRNPFERQRSPSAPCLRSSGSDRPHQAHDRCR